MSNHEYIIDVETEPLSFDNGINTKLTRAIQHAFDEGFKKITIVGGPGTGKTGAAFLFRQRMALKGIKVAVFEGKNLLPYREHPEPADIEIICTMKRP